MVDYGLILYNWIFLRPQLSSHHPRKTVAFHHRQVHPPSRLQGLAQG